MRSLSLCIALAAMSVPCLEAASCHSLVSLSLPNTHIQFAAETAATSMLGPGEFVVKTPDFCRVGGLITPASDSDIHFEVWLPLAGWNGKFRAVGNGGFAGSINYAEMATVIGDGYATASTDTGHRADGLDSGWALGHPEKIVDFGYRAVHEMTVKAKQVIEAFYGTAPGRSYFAACSNGGRQALMEAQRFPEDYDGILAGAPAYWWTHLLISSFYNAGKPMLENRAFYIPKEKIPALANAVNAACDTNDGVKDGIVSDPTACHFDASVLLCKGPETDACFTPLEANSLDRIYRGARNGQSVVVFPGLEPGGEDGPGGWQAWITGPDFGQALGLYFSLGFQQNMVFSDPGWNYKKSNMATALETADEKLAPVLNATDANLKPFQARGGKLIVYHGWSDAAIPPLNAVSYYENVTKTMGAATTDSFMRLYLVPGMQHCGGGPGPDYFGEPQPNMFGALVDWVEQGKAPNAIITTKHANADGVETTRPICVYPERALYDGKGDPHKAESFHCGR